MSRRPARRALLAGLVACLLVLAPTEAGAHAGLVDTDPADGQVVPTAPERLTVRFDESVVLATAGNELLDARGRPVDAAFSTDGAVLSVVPDDALADGTYLLSWRVISADSHPVTGGITFSVGEPSESVVPLPSSQDQREVNVLKAAAEALRYGGVLLTAGLAIFAAIAAPVTRRDATARRGLRRATGAGAAAALLGALLLVPLTALWESGEPLGRWISALTWTGPSLAAAALIALGAAGVLVAPRLGGRALTGAGAGVALGSLAVVGHTRSYGPSWLVLPADLLHVTAAAVWAGGLVGLLVIAAGAPRARDAARVVARFSTLAAGAVALLAAGGIVLYWRISGSFAGLWQTGYGRLVLAKALATAVVVAVGAWNRRHLVARVERSADTRRTLRRTLAAEVGVLAVVVALTGVLVSASPRGSALADTPERAADPVAFGTVLAAVAVSGALGAAALRFLPFFRKDLP